MMFSFVAPRRNHATVVAALALTIAGCDASKTIEPPPTVTGRRVQATDVVARSAPLRVRAYELKFSDAPGANAQALRAALLVDFAGGDGYARGFVEWGKSGEPPWTYLADGRARQRESLGVTVFDLALSYIEVPSARRLTPIRERTRPVRVQVVVDEATGDATLTRRP